MWGNGSVVRVAVVVKPAALGALRVRLAADEVGPTNGWGSARVVGVGQKAVRAEIGLIDAVLRFGKILEKGPEAHGIGILSAVFPARKGVVLHVRCVGVPFVSDDGKSVGAVDDPVKGPFGGGAGADDVPCHRSRSKEPGLGKELVVLTCAGLEMCRTRGWRCGGSGGGSGGLSEIVNHAAKASGR